MVFERISLIQIYDALKIVNENEGKVESILINRDVKYGTKTFPRFRDIAHLRQFINQEYPYMAWEPDCECVTCEESVCRLLNFNIVESSTYSIFVNNIRKDYESAKELRMSVQSVNALRSLFKSNLEVVRAYDFFTCFPYVEPQETYLEFDDSPEDCYIQIVTNPVYDKLVEDIYKPTLRTDFPTISKTPCPQLFLTIPVIPEDSCFGFRLTAIAQGQAEGPDGSGSAFIKIEQCDPDQPITIISLDTGLPVTAPGFEQTQDGTTQFILDGLPVGPYLIVVGDEDFACLSQSTFYISYDPCSLFELSLSSTNEGDCDIIDISVEQTRAASTDQSSDGEVRVDITGAVPQCIVSIENTDTSEIVFEGEFDSLSFVIGNLPVGNYLISTIDGQQCQLAVTFSITSDLECVGFALDSIESTDETNPV